MGVLKIAKPGGSADTDDEKDLIFTSDRNCLVEIFSGFIDVVTDEFGYGTGTFNHGLGYRPAYYCFVRDPLSTTDWYPNQDGFNALITNVDTNNLNVLINYKEPEQTYRIFYSIFGNQQEDGTGTGNNNVSGKLKVAKTGYNADTETDARNMQFFSGKNVYKLDPNLSGSTTITINAPDVVTKEITHNLGYVPVCFVICSTTGQMLPNETMTYWMDSTKLYIYVEDLLGSSSYNLTFKYKITRDKIT